MSVIAAQTRQNRSSTTREKITSWLRTGIEGAKLEAILTLLPFTAEKHLDDQEKRGHVITVVAPHIRRETPMKKGEEEIHMRGTDISLRISKDHLQEVTYSIAEFEKETHYRPKKSPSRKFMKWVQKKALYGAKGALYFTVGNTTLNVAMDGIRDTVGGRVFLLTVGGTAALYWTYYALTALLEKAKRREEKRKQRLFSQWKLKKEYERLLEWRNNPAYN